MEQSCKCGHGRSLHEISARDFDRCYACSCTLFSRRPEPSLLDGIEEQLKRLNATMERFEPFLAANRPTTARAYCCLRSSDPEDEYHSEIGRASCVCDCHFTENAPTPSQEAQQTREDLKPVVREGDEEFSALAASLYEALQQAIIVFQHDAKEMPGSVWTVERKYGPLYRDYKAQQRDHDNADREDAER